MKNLVLDQEFDLLHDNFTLALDDRMIMGSKVNNHLSQISLLMHNIIHANNARMLKRHDIANFAKGWTRAKQFLLKP